MNIIYSGFDTIVFAIQGALSATALKHLDLFKEKAVNRQQDIAFEFDEGTLRGLIAPTGAKGGYAYLLKFEGELGHVISLKKSLNRNEWNGHVKLRALALASYGLEETLARVFSNLSRIGFSEHGISLNRIDYAMDFLNAGLELDPTQFVAHSRVKKSAHKIELNAYSRGQICESVTLGKMPNRQIIVYDKRREVIDKRKPAWFEIWGLNPKDFTQTVHRVEIRLGKNELYKTEIRTIDDMKSRVNAVMKQAVEKVRYVTPCNDTNVSRWPNQPIWDHVQSHVEQHVFQKSDYVDIARVKQVIKAQKALESKKQVLGNMARLSALEDMDRDQIKNEMTKFVQEEFSEIEANNEHSFWKSRAKTQDRFSFL